MFEVESDVEANSALMIDDPLEGAANANAGPVTTLKSISVDASAAPLAMGVQTPMDVEGEEEEMETGEAVELSLPTPERETAMSLLYSPKPTPSSI